MTPHVSDYSNAPLPADRSSTAPTNAPSRTHAAAGLVATAILALSAFAHSVLGWRELGRQLATTNAPPDLTRGLGIGWVFGGVCMATFALITGWTFWQRWRGRAAPRLPAAVIAGCYLLFGAGALAATRADPFYTVFLVPGALLAYAASGR